MKSTSVSRGTFFLQSLALFLAFALGVVPASEAQDSAVARARTLRARRAAAMRAAPDAIILLRSVPTRMSLYSDGFHQSATFFYLTGLPNVIGAVLALDARRNESWLFVPAVGELSGFARYFNPPYGYIARGEETARALGLEHVAPWTELDAFLAQRLAEDSTLLVRGPFRTESVTGPSLPSYIAAGQNEAMMWQRELSARFPRARLASASAVDWVRDVKDSAEIATLRRVAESSAAALRAGLRSLQPGRRQREAEVDVLAACVRSGASGISFWPWIMTGPNSGFLAAVQSLGDYQFLDREMRSGELARLDVGCAREYYEGDVGRTAPVSGHFDPGQREAWELLVAAYRTALAAIRPGRATREVMVAFRDEIAQRRPSLITMFGKRTAEVALGPEGLRWSGPHGVGIESAEFLGDTLRAGQVLALEPALIVDGVGLYLEDMILVTPTGREVLTKGLPYSAHEIEQAMRRPRP